MSPLLGGNGHVSLPSEVSRINNSHTILAVEDRAEVGAAISNVLTDAGYKVVGPAK
jgi:hypothetical protein